MKEERQEEKNEDINIMNFHYNRNENSIKKQFIFRKGEALLLLTSL